MEGAGPHNCKLHRRSAPQLEILVIFSVLGSPFGVFSEPKISDPWSSFRKAVGSLISGAFLWPCGPVLGLSCCPWASFCLDGSLQRSGLCSACCIAQALCVYTQTLLCNLKIVQLCLGQPLYIYNFLYNFVPYPHTHIRLCIWPLSRTMETTWRTD